MDLARILGVILGILISIPVYTYLALRVVLRGFRVFQVKKRSAPPPCLTDPELGTHKYMVVNGVKIHYVEAGEEDKPLIVFVHGFPEFWFVWRYQLKHFKNDYRVVALDNRGYNDSEKPKGIENYHIKTLVDDVRALVEGLGVSKFTLVGHDWGGAISWTFAALYPELLDNLVICNCPHLLALQEQRQNGWEQNMKFWYTVFFQCPLLPELFAMSEDMKVLEDMLADAGLDKDSEEIEAYKYAFREMASLTGGMNYYRCALTKESRDFWKDPENQKKRQLIKVRTLQIFGTEDKYLTVEGAQATAKFVEDHRLELIKRASHWVQQEVPDRVNSLIQEFLDFSK